MWEVLFERLKSVHILTISLLGLEPMPYTSVALMARYLNVSQSKLGTIIIQNIHIQLPKRDVSMANSNYF
jgi:hypothetical protein